MASHPAAHTYYGHREEESGALLKILALFLGLGVGVLAIVAVWMGASAQEARNDARAAAAAAAKPTADTSMPGMAMPAAGEGARPTPSFAGIAPANADALAAAHRAYPAELPAATPGRVLNVHLGINHRVLSIAPGIKYQAWTFDTGVPGPVIHARQGQMVRVTLTNNAPMPHSVDFHAARVAPDKAFVDILPGKSFTFSFKVNDPGVYMYHCGTKPVLAHIANGMYGAIVVDPANLKLLPPVHHAYVLVSGEWYLNAPGDRQPAGLDMVKAHQMTPDWSRGTVTRRSTSSTRSRRTAGTPFASTSSTRGRASTRTSTSSARCSSAPGSTRPSPIHLCTTSRPPPCRRAAAGSST
jgi:FtsP/CotA-like multicopper oxidase with cupredoxin domain